MQNDDAYEDTTEVLSSAAHITYADWRGPEHDDEEDA